MCANEWFKNAVLLPDRTPFVCFLNLSTNISRAFHDLPCGLQFLLPKNTSVISKTNNLTTLWWWIPVLIRLITAIAEIISKIVTVYCYYSDCRKIRLRYPKWTSLRLWRRIPVLISLLTAIAERISTVVMVYWHYLSWYFLYLG